MLRRVALLAKARLGGEWFGDKGGSLPIAPLLFQGVIASALLWMIRGDLDGHGHAVFTLTHLLALSLLSLLGELAPLLASDPAEEWVGGLPVRPQEVRLAKIVVCLTVTMVMSASILVPAMLLAPKLMPWADRFTLAGLGLVQAFATTALGLVLHVLFQGRRTGWLVLFQAMLFVALFVGFVAGLGRASMLSGWEQAEGGWLAVPSVWFAGPLAPNALGPATWIALTATVVSLAVLLWAPFPKKAEAIGTQSILGTLLHPFRWLALRIWVKPAQRPVFDWVFHALPAEKDFGLRTYPLMAIPFAFLFLGADGVRPEGQGLLAILAFAPLTYLPILLLFVPTTQTPKARVVVDSTPITPVLEREGAIKAIAIRILIPLYVLLAIVVASVAGAALAIQLIPPAAAFTVIMLRPLWNHYVDKGALSQPAEDLGGVWRDDLTGGMFVVAVISVILALLVWKYVPGPAGGMTLAAALMAWELIRPIHIKDHPANSPENS